MTQLVWLVTGCSSGFGLQFVRSILARSDFVIATARTLSSIKHHSAFGVTTLQLDVTSSQQDIDDIVARATSIHGRIDVLLNNAGHVQIGLWEDLENEDWVRQFEVNVFGPVKGVIVFISSINGFVGHPAVGAYSASKHALEGAVESLAKEIAPYGLRTLLIEPGRFRTQLLSSKTLKVKLVDSGSPDYAKVYQELLPDISAEDGRQPGDPEKLAAIVSDLVRREGVAVGREIPLRMFSGTDAWDEIEHKLTTTLNDFKAWEEATKSTDQTSA